MSLRPDRVPGKANKTRQLVHRGVATPEPLEDPVAGRDGIAGEGTA